MRIGIDRYRCCAMVQYDTMEAAKEALNAVRGTIIGNSRKLMVSVMCVFACLCGEYVCV